MTTEGMERREAAGSDQLVTSGTPLRYFKARYIGSGDDPDHPVQIDEVVAGSPTPVQHLNFLDVDLETLRATIPYMYPTIQLSINYRIREGQVAPHERSVWGMLIASLGLLRYTKSTPRPNTADNWLAGEVHEPGEVATMQHVFGQFLEMECEPEHEFGKDEDTQQPIVGTVWYIKSVSSDGSVTSGPAQTTAEAALAILGTDGKDRTAFTEAALENTVLRAVNSTVIDGSLLAGLVAEGKVVETDGVFRPA